MSVSAGVRSKSQPKKPETPVDAEFEEGEVRVIDGDSYIISDTNFTF
jgi:hypothetical protein